MKRVSVTRNGGEVPASELVRAKRAPVSMRARRAFVDLVAAGYTASAAARTAGVHRQRFYELRDRDRTFAEEWAQAVETGTDVLEQAAFEIATNGALEETFDKGGRLVSSRRRQDPATVLLLASRRPAIYSERTRVEMTGHVDVDHAIAGPVITLAELLERQRELEVGPPSLSEAEVVDYSDEPIDSTDGDGE